MDLTIPGGLNGRECFSAIRQIAPDIPAIVSSGYSKDPVMAQYQDYGFAGTLPKPYLASDVFKVLNQFFYGHNN
jgi:DNA-binding NarL/FixJ family response regulator